MGWNKNKHPGKRPAVTGKQPVDTGQTCGWLLDTGFTEGMVGTNAVVLMT